MNFKTLKYNKHNQLEKIKLKRKKKHEKKRKKDKKEEKKKKRQKKKKKRQKDKKIMIKRRKKRRKKGFSPKRFSLGTKQFGMRDESETARHPQCQNKHVCRCGREMCVCACDEEARLRVISGNTF